MIATNEVGNTSLTLDPILRRFSEQQLSVATTWANHFCVPLEEQRQFIRDYLKATSTPPVWCVTLEHDGRRIAIARFGNILQWFDGTTIRTTTCTSKHRIPRAKPSLRSAQGLANRIHTLHYTLDDGLLTSFAQKARDLAAEIAAKDLGKRSALLPGLDSQSPHLRYLRPRSRYYLRMIGTALRDFCAVLDPEVLFAVRSVQCVSPQLYNWLASGDKKRRLQALRAQPVLLPMLILSGYRDTFPWPSVENGLMESPWPGLNAYLPGPVWAGNGNGMLGKVADDGLPLLDVLVWILQAPRSSIRYLGTCRPGRAGGALYHIRRAGHEAWERMLKGAALGNRRPATKADWQTLYSLLDKIPYAVTWSPYRDCLDYCPLDLNLLLRGTPTAWNDPAWSSIEATLTDYQELYRHLEPGVGKAYYIVSQYFVRKPFAQIANMIHQFHNYLDGLLKEMRAELVPEEDELLATWPALLLSGTAACPNGVNIVELRCQTDLLKEHTVMKHCIDGYDYSAFQGRCRLVSFRQGDTVLASAEIRLTRKGDSVERRPDQKFHCVQLRGVRNQPVLPDSPAGRACRWFMQGLESGRIPSNEVWPDETRRISRYAKYEWESRVSEAVQAWIKQHMGGN